MWIKTVCSTCWRWLSLQSHIATFPFIVVEPNSKFLRALLLILAVVRHSAATKTYSIFSSYLGDRCDGTPYLVTVSEDENCTTSSCASFDTLNSTVSANMVTSECSTDYLQIMRDKFQNSPYLIQLYYGDDNCTEFSLGFGYPATGSCVGAYNETDGLYVIASFNGNGSASFKQFLDRTCFSDQLYTTDNIDKDTIASHSCDVNKYRWYSSNDNEAANGVDTTSTSNFDDGLSTSAIVGIALGSFVFAAMISGALWVLTCRSRLDTMETQSQEKASQSSKSIPPLHAAIRGPMGLWSDDVITAKRIPRDKVTTNELISRGAFGEVYSGVFNGRQVAVKMLLPNTREKLHRVNEFLAEAKMTATVDHPHIVSFVGAHYRMFVLSLST